MTLLKDRKLDHATINICWHTEITPNNADHMSTKFLEFPNTYKLHLNSVSSRLQRNHRQYLQVSKEEESGWINDENLLHFAASTTKLQIGINKCSAPGILRTFEVKHSPISKIKSYEICSFAVRLWRSATDQDYYLGNGENRRWRTFFDESFEIRDDRLNRVETTYA